MLSVQRKIAKRTAEVAGQVSGEGNRPPSVPGDIQLRALPAGPEMSSRLFGLAPVGSRRFTRSSGNVLVRRFILLRGCVVSVPLPWLSPNHFRGPPVSWRRDLPQPGPKALPSVALPLPTPRTTSSPYLNWSRRTGPASDVQTNEGYMSSIIRAPVIHGP